MLLGLNPVTMSLPIFQIGPLLSAISVAFTSSRCPSAFLGAGPQQRHFASHVFCQQLRGFQQIVLVVLFEHREQRGIVQRTNVHGRGIHRGGDVHEFELEGAAGQRQIADVAHQRQVGVVNRDAQVGLIALRAARLRRGGRFDGPGAVGCRAGQRPDGNPDQMASTPVRDKNVVATGKFFFMGILQVMFPSPLERSRPDFLHTKARGYQRSGPPSGKALSVRGGLRSYCRFQVWPPSSVAKRRRSAEVIVACNRIAGLDRSPVRGRVR